MLNSASDFMTPSTFAPYTFTHQPGPSSAMAVAAAATHAAYSLEAVAAGSLMHNAIRAPNPYRSEIPRGNKRERTKFDQYQLDHMETFFKGKQYPDGNEREEMAKMLNLTDTKVQIWFKNRRAKERNQKHLDELMARGRAANGGEFVQKPIGIDDPQVAVPLKKKRKAESPLPDPVETKHVKQELTTTNDSDYSFDNSAWEDSSKDLKNLYQASSYPFALPDTAATAFPGANANWMNQMNASYNYPFNYFSAAPYYATNMAPQAAVTYNDFYPYSQMSGFKDAKLELPSQSPTISPNLLKPTEIAPNWTVG